VSQENVDFAKQVYAAWNDNDWDRLVELTPQDHELHLTGLVPGFKPVYHGPQGMREVLTGFAALWKDPHFEVERVEDAGERVVGLTRLRGTGLGTGVPVTIEYAHVFRFEEGRCVRTDTYRSWQEALQAAGLE
jgi:ketosteroid isomerase-like protein